MHVLVTGATGTVGRFVVPALAAAGSWMLISRLSPGFRSPSRVTP